MNKYDVIVVGGGPSGSAAAYSLARNGIKTALIEKEKLPRYKTCGGGLVYRARKLLPVDVQAVVEREFLLAEMFFVKEGRQYSVQRPKPIISMTMRDKLDHFLVNEAVNAGVTLLEEHRVSHISNGSGLTIHAAKGKITANFIIAADGALSPVAKMMGWKETRHLIPALEFEVTVNDRDFERLAAQARFDIDAVPCGYAWSFPKRNHLSLGLASTKRGKVDLKKYYIEYLKRLGITEVLNETKHGYQIPLSPRKDGFSRNGVLLTGDAAGFADPITAEGISNAIFSGQLAAESVIEGKMTPEVVEQIYQNKLDAALLPQLKTGRYLAKILYTQPWLRKALFKKYGQKLCEALTDIFMGDRTYPHEATKRAKQYIKATVLKKI